MRPLHLALVISSCLIVAAIVVQPRTHSKRASTPPVQSSRHLPSGTLARIVSLPTRPAPSSPVREFPRPWRAEPTEFTRRVDHLVAAKQLELGRVGSILGPQVVEVSLPADWVGSPVTVQSALATLSRDSGCFSTSYRTRLYSLPGATPQADEVDVIDREEVDRLAGRLRASRPSAAETLEQTRMYPEEFLAQMGITPETLALHRADLLATFLGGRGYVPTADLSQLLPELDEILSFALVRQDLISTFLATSSGSTQSRWHFVQIPGEPWIVAGTESETPDCLPWYVRVGNQSWYTQDRDLARTLIGLLSPDIEWDMQPDWRERLWTERNYWSRTMARVEAALIQARETNAGGH